MFTDSFNTLESHEAELQQVYADFVERSRRTLAVDRITVMLLEPRANTSRVVFSWRTDQLARARLRDQTNPLSPVSNLEPITLSVNLQSADEPLGSVLFHRIGPLGYSEVDQEKAVLLARQLARALSKFFHAGTAPDEILVQDPIDFIAAALVSAPDIEQSFVEFTVRLRELLEFDWAAINIIDEPHGLIIIRHLVGQPVSGRLVNAIRPLVGSQTREVLTTRGPVLRDDILSDPRNTTDAVLGGSGLRSAVMVPLFSGDQVLGVLSLRSRRPRAYDRQSVSILEKLASRIAPIIEDSHLLQRLQINVKELALIKEVAPLLASTLNIGEVFESVCRAAHQVIPFQQANLYWISSDGLQINHLGASPNAPPASDPARPLEESSIFAWLTHQKEIIGQIALVRKNDVFLTPDLEILNRLATQLTPAVQNTRLYQHTEQQLQEFRFHPTQHSGGEELKRWSSQLGQLPLVNLAHQMRTPLTAIKGYTTTLLQPDLTWTPEERNQFLHTIDAEVDHLNEVIGSLLSLTGETGEIVTSPPQPLYLDRLLPTLEFKSPGFSISSEIELSIQPDLPAVVVDPVVLHSVITHLVCGMAGNQRGGTGISITAKLTGDQPSLWIGPAVPAGEADTGAVPTANAASEFRLVVCRRLLARQGVELLESSAPWAYWFSLPTASAPN